VRLPLGTPPGRRFGRGRPLSHSPHLLRHHPRLAASGTPRLTSGGAGRETDSCAPAAVGGGTEGAGRAIAASGTAIEDTLARTALGASLTRQAPGGTALAEEVALAGADRPTGPA